MNRSRKSYNSRTLNARFNYRYAKIKINSRSNLPPLPLNANYTQIRAKILYYYKTVRHRYALNIPTTFRRPNETFVSKSGYHWFFTCFFHHRVGLGGWIFIFHRSFRVKNGARVTVYENFSYVYFVQVRMLV